jgi:NitT/TauT family transport system substrate-binding protein
MKTLWLIFGLSIGLLVLPIGCSRKSSSIVVQLDWVAEPEHGGFYQALAKGYFKAAGLEVNIIPGGPNGNVMQKIASGQADIGQSDSTNAILAIAQGAPLINIGAVFQNDPSVLMLHAENPVSRFEELNGKTIMARGEWAFLPYLRNKYHIDFKIIPHNFSVANFIVDKNFIQQGYYIAEPYHITRGGASEPKYLYAWDAGFDAYTVLIANRPWAAAHADQLRAFMRAYAHGWQDYLEGNPAPAHELMKKANANNTDEFLAFSRARIIQEKLVVGRQNGSTAQIGRISRERFQIQLNQLEELNIIAKSQLTVEQVMTTEYLP